MKSVVVTVDRPLHSEHPKYKGLIYELNYGFVKGIMAPDGEEQDCYILGVDEPVDIYEGNVIAVIERLDDIEEKWVVANQDFTVDQIRRLTHFQEKYYSIVIRKTEG